MKLTYFLKPISLNHAIKTSARGGFIRRYKSHGAIDFDRNFNQQTKQYFPQIKEFVKTFNKNKNMIILKIEYHVESICNKQGQFKLRSGDLDNWNKYTIDALSKAVGIDDALIKRIECEKFNSDQNRIEIEIIAI